MRSHPQKEQSTTGDSRQGQRGRRVRPVLPGHQPAAEVLGGNGGECGAVHEGHFELVAACRESGCSFLNQMNELRHQGRVPGPLVKAGTDAVKGFS